MPWPLFLLVPIIIIIAGIAVAPSLLTNPNGYFKNRKKLKESFSKAKKEKTLYKTELVIFQVPSMLGYSQYHASGFTTVCFQESCLYFKALGIIRFCLLYDEIESIIIEKAVLSFSYSKQLKFKLKDKGRASMIFKISRRNEDVADEIEKATGIPILREL